MNKGMYFVLLICCIICMISIHETRGFVLTCYSGNGYRTTPKPIGKRCTHILHNYVLWKDNEVKNRDKYDQGYFDHYKAMKKKDKTLKIIAVVGKKDADHNVWENTAKTVKNRQDFAWKAASYLRDNDFDGIEIAWNDGSDNYKLLMEQVFNIFSEEAKRGKTRRLIFAPLYLRSLDKVKQLQLSRWVDYVHIWSFYHLYTTKSNNLLMYPTSSVRDVKKDIAAWINAGYHAEQLIMPLVTHAYYFLPISQSPGNKEAKQENTGYYPYTEMCDLTENQKWTTQWNGDFCMRSGRGMNYGEEEWVAYDDARSFLHKLQYLKSHALAGAFIYSLEWDDATGTACKESGGHKFPLTRLAYYHLIRCPSLATPNNVTAACLSPTADVNVAGTGCGSGAKEKTADESSSSIITANCVVLVSSIIVAVYFSSCALYGGL